MIVHIPVFQQTVSGTQDMETERLYFSRLSLEDSESLFQVFGDPQVMKYWIGGADGSMDSTRHRVVEINKHWETHQFGDWGIYLKSNLELIGFGGLHYISNMKEVNIGYAFKKPMWGNGFGFEACKEILRVGFTELEFRRVVAVIWPDNMASINLVKKCGFQYWKSIIWNDSDRVVYFIDNADIGDSHLTRLNASD